jgi:hypothetical protein
MCVTHHSFMRQCGECCTRGLWQNGANTSQMLFRGGKRVPRLACRVSVGRMTCYGDVGCGLGGITHSTWKAFDATCLHVCTPICLQVLDVDFAAGKATIKLVPRLDLTAMAKDHRSGGWWHSCADGTLVALACPIYMQSRLASALQHTITGYVVPTERRMDTRYAHVNLISCAVLWTLRSLKCCRLLLQLALMAPTEQARRGGCLLAARLCALLHGPSRPKRLANWGCLWDGTSRTPAWWCSTHTSENTSQDEHRSQGQARDEVTALRAHRCGHKQHCLGAKHCCAD